VTEGHNGVVREIGTALLLTERTGARIHTRINPGVDTRINEWVDRDRRVKATNPRSNVTMLRLG
jgi:hypothetical protein